MANTIVIAHRNNPNCPNDKLTAMSVAAFQLASAPNSHAIDPQNAHAQINGSSVKPDWVLKLFDIGLLGL